MPCESCSRSSRQGFRVVVSSARLRRGKSITAPAYDAHSGRQSGGGLVAAIPAYPGSKHPLYLPGPYIDRVRRSRSRAGWVSSRKVIAPVDVQCDVPGPPHSTQFLWPVPTARVVMRHSGVVMAFPHAAAAEGYLMIGGLAVRPRGDLYGHGAMVGCSADERNAPSDPARFKLVSVWISLS